MGHTATWRRRSFWARRMCHETVVHAADALLAAGRPASIHADVAADGIDEWLTVLTVPEGTEPDPRAAALPAGRSLHVHATDEGLAGAGEWLLRPRAGRDTGGPGAREGRRGRDRAGRPAAADAAAPGARPTTRR